MLPAGTTYQVIPDTVPQDVELHQAQLPVAVPLGSHRLRRKLHSLNQAGAESEQLGRRGDGHREGKIRGDVARACAQPACSPALLALCSREGCKRSDSLGVTLHLPLGTRPVPQSPPPLQQKMSRKDLVHPHATEMSLSLHCSLDRSLSTLPTPTTPNPKHHSGDEGRGYVHEVHHAAAGLQAEAIGPQVFVCKKNQFQHLDH